VQATIISFQTQRAERRLGVKWLQPANSCHLMVHINDRATARSDSAHFAGDFNAIVRHHIFGYLSSAVLLIVYSATTIS